MAAIERALTAFCGYERINYLMLMMVDPHVHFHVIPRYSGRAHGTALNSPTPAGPGRPDLKSASRSLTTTRSAADALTEIWR